jgi:hypothetical protein
VQSLLGKYRKTNEKPRKTYLRLKTWSDFAGLFLGANPPSPTSRSGFRRAVTALSPPACAGKISRFIRLTLFPNVFAELKRVINILPEGQF